MKVDFHSHTFHSADSLSSIEDIIRSARIQKLDKLVITDHNSIAGALEAYCLAPDLIIVGEEIQTTQGEFLAAFVTHPLPRGLEPMEALKRLRDQGSFISVSHPFDPQRSGWSSEMLNQLAPHLDAIEVLNARILNPGDNEKAVAFAKIHNLPGLAGSDGHHPSEIGRVYSILPDFHDADSLRRVVNTGKNGGTISSPWVHFFSVWARILKKLRK
ncbi:MAG: PHP domain-containing protein [Chloroflexi bacterium]|nr:PHP domain-containing protein [Chloroflexota bacterium]